MSKTPKYLIQGFGALLFIACLAAVIWSFTRPAVKEGPMPDPWKAGSGSGKGDGSGGHRQGTTERSK